MTDEPRGLEMDGRLTRAEFLDRLDRVATESFGSFALASDADQKECCWAQRAIGIEALRAHLEVDGQLRYASAGLIAFVEGVSRTEMEAVIRASDHGTAVDRLDLVARLRSAS